ncbi:uncharacterized protein A4U43_C05F4590 [Asparagus officinalis]|uniref:Uncharacterized protein n=1 Tax=Asparagus officinalis TaxID=4686 RepID=A0A5P1EQD1_ASPOF|nr:uncharacterized protein A4U43_C05F4590 [Asparagus officinalis]
MQLHHPYSEGTAETNGTNSISENNPSSGENGCKPDDNHVGVSGVFSGARAQDDYTLSGAHTLVNTVRVGGSNARNSGASGARAQDESGSDDMLYSDTLSGAHTLVNTVRVGGSNAGNSGASGAAHTLVNTVRVGGSNAGNSGASGNAMRLGGQVKWNHGLAKGSQVAK